MEKTNYLPQVTNKLKVFNPAQSRKIDEQIWFLWKLYEMNIADMAEWFRELDITLSDWCCSVSKVLARIIYRGRTKICQLKYNTVGLNFHTYIYMSAILIPASNSIRGCRTLTTSHLAFRCLRLLDKQLVFICSD